MDPKKRYRAPGSIKTAVILLCGLLPVACSPTGQVELPHIIYILADDLGYGDLSSFNPDAAWTTGQIDRLAAEGMIFTDAHSGSAVCTPTRYGILTGRYAWRTHLKQGVLWGLDKPLIQAGETTVARLLREHGYATACIGKWHLGLGWQYHTGDPDSVDFSRPVSGGPATVGFDYFFGISASLDIPPYVYIENGAATTIPVRFTEDSSDMGWWRRGLTGEDFVHREVLPLFTEKAVQFIDDHMKNNRRNPFFLYFPLPAPHTPILPTEEFAGKSRTNPYGDFVLQVDGTLGRILDALERHGIDDKTLIIFTSDNGCSPEANYQELARFGHDPSHLFRGAKADIFEGGHRIPFVARWPGKIAPGSVSTQVICLTDLLATLAAITGDSLDPDEGVDSYNLLPVMLDESDVPLREATVHHSINGSFAIRKGKWKLVMCPGSGGWSAPLPGSPGTDSLPPCQLYDLEADAGETQNLYGHFPGVETELRTLLEQYILEGRSTEGEVQKNTPAPDWPGISWAGEAARIRLTGEQ